MTKKNKYRLAVVLPMGAEIDVVHVQRMDGSYEVACLFPKRDIAKAKTDSPICWIDGKALIVESSNPLKSATVFYLDRFKLEQKA